MATPYYRHSWDPILIHLTDDTGIRYYGLAYIVSFAVVAVLLRLYWSRGRSPVPPAVQSELWIGLVLGTLLGARIGYYLFYQPAELLRNPFVLLGGRGMSSHGGFTGVTLALWWVAWKHRLPFATLADLAVTFEPPAFSMGRIANFINGELVGKPTTVPWAVIFPGHTEPRHPSQLYEAVLEGFLLMAYTQWRLWRTPVVKQSPGRLAGEWCIGYALLRVVVEQFREPDPGVAPVLGMNRGAWISLGFALAGTTVIWFARRKASGTRNLAAEDGRCAQAPGLLRHPFTTLDGRASVESKTHK